MFEQLFQPGIAPIAGAVIGGIFSLNLLFLKWLMSSFSTLRKDLKQLAENTDNLLDQREERDQARHIENLYRFEKISVALARLGSSNGTYDKEI